MNKRFYFRTFHTEIDPQHSDESFAKHDAKINEWFSEEDSQICKMKKEDITIMQKIKSGRIVTNFFW
ncbi:MAG: hypothetical protein WC697_02840 [Patescibacteria group bacterium]|jgi:hypothetical protein